MTSNKLNQYNDNYKQNHIYKKNLSQSSSKSSSKSCSTFSSKLILKNTQYLTNLQNYFTYQSCYTEVQIQYFYQAIDPAAFCKLIVQNIYLLQICFLFKIKVYISLKFYVEKLKYIPTLHNVNIFQMYCFQNQIHSKQIHQKVKQSVLQNKFIKIFDQQQNKIQDFFYIIERLIKSIQVYLRCFQKNPKQSSSTNTQVQQNRKLLIQFIKNYENIIIKQKDKISQPRILIKFLEQTKLFRYHSMLVKIVNSTLFYSIKLFSPQLLEDLKNTVFELRKYFSYGVIQCKFEKSVVNLIDQYFTRLCRQNIIQITKSQGPKQEQQLINKDILSLFGYDQMLNESSDKLSAKKLSQYQKQAITASIFIPQQKYKLITNELFEQILYNKIIQKFEIDKDYILSKPLQIQISYIYVINQIRIKCIKDIDLLVDNMDYLNYLISSFNQCMKSTLIIDTIQKYRKSINKKIQKVITFQFTYKAKPNQQPLTKIMELIDVGILASKIFINQLSKKSYIKLQDYSKRQQTCSIFYHYQNIFRNLIKKFYNDIK